MKKKCVCVLLSAAMAMTMFAGCGSKDQASAGETNTVASADAENYKKPNEFFGGQEIFSDFSKWTEEIPTVNYGLYTYTIEDIMSEAVQSILQGADIDETLANTQVQAEAAVLN